MKLQSPIKLIIFIFSTFLISSQGFADATTTGVPDKAVDLSGLASQLGKSLSNKKVPGFSQADVKAAMEKKSKTATQLSAVFPEEKTRKDMEKLYNLALFTHQQSEVLLGLPKNDIYGAMGAFLYGNWSSYNNGKVVADKYLPTVVKDIKGIFEPTDFAKKFEESSKAEQKLAYEEFAMIGNWMIIMQAQLKKEPNAEASEKLKSLATEYFAKLQLKPEQFNISDKGHIELSQ